MSIPLKHQEEGVGHELETCLRKEVWENEMVGWGDRKEIFE
jgi:hypothetical protein